MRPPDALSITCVEQNAWAGRKQWVNIGDLDIAYVEIAGAGPPLLLIHGFTDTSRSFSLLAPHLAGRRLIMPDLRGHGASQAGGGYRVADFAEDIAGLIRHLRLDRPIVVGHSLGGMVAIALAARQPDLIGGLVVLASTLKPGFTPDHALPVGILALHDPISPADPFFAWWHACQTSVPRTFLAGLATEASAMPAARWRAILEEVRITDLTAEARAVRAKALIIAGACDPLFDEPHQQALADALTGSRLVWAQNCGHNPHWEDPAFVASAMAGLLSGR
ncbi:MULTISPECIES: alpha/beta fold hydrolase [unclassified Mesorhizobium]|uniref:alpha/beta fold hydrolase n=1 Tax=unclassified Mesorhizobium TaxID=325217 RepID=UPI001CCEEADC|nr:MULTISPECIES: alpha/beta hydrolase [unclassified Mesorhizobium]MBZ9694495.1 alpha/beta hydrolase [Mesorhizobium sp. CO1-1-9]MBZ9723053.1 alpha/beta hydrolase [Mesorhizobium sp. CO1-1-11]